MHQLLSQMSSIGFPPVPREYGNIGNIQSLLERHSRHVGTPKLMSVQVAPATTFHVPGSHLFLDMGGQIVYFKQAF